MRPRLTRKIPTDRMEDWMEDRTERRDAPRPPRNMMDDAVEDICKEDSEAIIISSTVGSTGKQERNRQTIQWEEQLNKKILSREKGKTNGRLSSLEERQSKAQIHLLNETLLRLSETSQS